MGIEVTFAQVEPTSSESANNLMYQKTSVRSTSAVPFVSLKPTASISYKTEAPMPFVTVRPTARLKLTSSGEQAPVRTLTTTVQPPTTQPSPATGGAEGGPVLCPAGSSVPRLSARAASAPDFSTSDDFISEDQTQSAEKKSPLLWIVGGISGLIVLGFVFRKRGR